MNSSYTSSSCSTWVSSLHLSFISNQQPAMGDKPSDLKVHINGQHTFLLHQRTLCSFSTRLKKMVKQEKKRRSLKGTGNITEIKITDFPGGPDGFELVSRFCYNNGRVPTPPSPSNICLLHCSAVLLEMTEDLSASNLLVQAETFLDGLFYWTWDDILTALKSCEPFFFIADSSGLLLKLISSLLAKILENSETPLTAATPFPYCPSSCSSPDNSGFRYSSSNKIPVPIRHSFTKEWWFDDLAILAPSIIEKVMKTLGAYRADNKNLVLTRFLLHYLKRAEVRHRAECGGLADTAVCGVVLMGRAAFSCRGLFWVLRIVSGFGLSRECRQRLERVIGLVMDRAILDDLLVSPAHLLMGGEEGVYDVSLVLRLVRVFVNGVEEGGVPLQRMKRVGRLIDKYLGEISPDQSLKVSKFRGVAESLPDSARDCFDGVYRALDIYLESHPALSSEERTRFCRGLNYEKLTLEACKDLAANPRIPPGVAIHAMVSQQSKLSKTSSSSDSMDSVKPPRRAAVSQGDEAESVRSHELPDEKEELRVNLQKMQNRVMELEKVCMEMKYQMTKMIDGRAIISRTAHQTSRGMTKLC